jgi:bisphosphoglycerate-dependent phosphoglycerate mutase family 1
MVLIVLRHGKSVWNQENRFTGFEDPPLCDQGKVEAKYASELLKNIHFDFIYSSDLTRSLETAQAIAKDQCYKEPITQIAHFKERDYGDLTGNMA